jgi:hypothetical protein
MGADRAQPLAGERAHAARRGMKHHPGAGRHAEHAPQQRLQREALQQRRSRRSLRHARRQRDAALRGKVAHLAIGADRRRGIGDAVAGAKALHALAHRFHHARRFQAEHQRHRHRVQRRIVPRRPCTSVKLTPIAVWRMRTCPLAGACGGTSRASSTSGPPKRRIAISSAI